MQTNDTASREQLTIFQLVLLILSIAVLAALLLDTVAPVTDEVSRIIHIFDTCVCVLLLVDFGARLWRAPDKRKFMKWGWIDLLASIPNVEWLRAGRLVRILRILRLLRALRAGHRVLQLILSNKPKSAFASVGLSSILLITISSVIVLVVETGPEANIQTAEDALWWSVTTVTTVGYGDKYPITTEGRILAMVLMVCGVGLFGTLSGLMASLLLGGREEESSEMRVVLNKLERLEQQLGLRGGGMKEGG